MEQEWEIHHHRNGGNAEVCPTRLTQEGKSNRCNNLDDENLNDILNNMNNPKTPAITFMDYSLNLNLFHFMLHESTFIYYHNHPLIAIKFPQLYCFDCCNLHNNWTTEQLSNCELNGSKTEDTKKCKAQRKTTLGESGIGLWKQFPFLPIRNHGKQKIAMKIVNIS